MLRTLRSLDFAGIRRPEPEALRSRLGTAARFLSEAALAFALARAAFFGGLAPFAMAVFAAAVATGNGVAPLLAGCVLGGWSGRLADYNLCLPAGCAAALAGDLLWDAAEPGIGRLRAALRRAPAIQARSPNASGETRAAALAGLAVLGPGLVLARGEPWPSAQATAAALAALAAAPLMTGVLSLTPGRRALLAEECLGLGLLCGMLAAGLHALWPPLALGFCALALAAGAPAGAALGAILGGALLLRSGDARLSAMLGLAGAAAQLCKGLPALPGACAVAASGLAAGLATGVAPPVLAGWTAGAAFAPLWPARLRGRLRAWLRPPAEGCDPDRLANRLRAETADRLRRMGEAFGELAEGYLAPNALPDGQALMGELRDRLCEGCPAFDGCWAGEGNRGARVLCDLAALAVRWSESAGDAPLFEEGVPSDLARRCRRSRTLPDRVGGALEDFARRRRGALRRDGENRLISSQFLQARRLLDGLAAAQARPVRVRDRQAARAAGVLERAGIALSDALLLSGRRASLVLTLRDGRWTSDLAARAAGVLERTFGRVYVPEGAGGRTLAFARLSRLRAATGVASVPREAGAPSGDSALCTVLDGDRLLAVICDGMGSGEAAARESAAAVRLLGRFLAAGADWPLAVETANALMLSAGADEMFSTMDLLLLDLSGGLAEFVKLAACPALISRGGAVERIEGGRLPLGILDRVEPAACRVQLAEGDVVLLASDGVMDAADPDALEALLADPGEDMNALAERVLRLADGANGDGVRSDDRTAVCVRLERRAG